MMLNEFKMVNIILFGPPGSGKGTQAKLIKNKYGLLHISTGNIFRDNINNNTSIGNKVKYYIDRGMLVPDKLTSNILLDHILKNKNNNGYIFDGYPRTLIQARHLNDILNKNFNSNINLIISLLVDEEVIIKRILKRGLIGGRNDDLNKDIILHRIKEYNDKTKILSKCNIYENIWININGNLDVDVVFNNISHILNKYL